MSVDRSTNLSYMDLRVDTGQDNPASVYYKILTPLIGMMATVHSGMRCASIFYYRENTWSMIWYNIDIFCFELIHHKKKLLVCSNTRTVRAGPIVEQFFFRSLKNEEKT